MMMILLGKIYGISRSGPGPHKATALSSKWIVLPFDVEVSRRPALVRMPDDLKA